MGTIGVGLFDLGASWLHDPSPSNPLSAMAETLRAPLLVTDFENDETFNLQGQKFSDRETASQYRAFEKNLFAAAVQARKKPSEFRHLSLEQTVKNRMTEAKWGHPLMQLYASLFEFDLGASLEKCSSTECIDGDWIAAEMDDRAEDGDIDPIFPVTGFGVIIDGLVSGDATDNRLLRPDVSKFPVLPGAQKVTYTARKPMKISLNTRVFEVVQSDGRCVVTAMAGEQMREWEADAVICTLPVGVLQARSIRFSPELSLAKTAAIDAIGSGNVVKIIMEFSKVFWDTHLSFLGIADATLCGGTDGRQQRGLCTFFMNGHKACKRKILITYAVGDGADIADSVSI